MGVDSCRKFWILAAPALQHCRKQPLVRYSSYQSHLSQPIHRYLFSHQSDLSLTALTTRTPDNQRLGINPTSTSSAKQYSSYQTNLSPPRLRYSSQSHLSQPMFGSPSQRSGILLTSSIQPTRAQIFISQGPQQPTNSQVLVLPFPPSANHILFLRAIFIV